MPLRTAAHLVALLLAGPIAAWVVGVARADGNVHPSAEATRPLAVGERIPDATLRDVHGKSVALSDVIANQPAVLVFYRGGW